MTKKTNPTMIGLFVVGAVILAIATAFIFSKERIFIRKDRYVVYFEGSVNGLWIGAPVKLKGVQIGIVEDIKVRFDTNSKKVLTPVYIEIEPDLVLPMNGNVQDQPDIETLIDHGLRAQLTILSIVTGRLYIEVDFLPDTPVKRIGTNDVVPEIPVVRSSSQEIQETVTQFVTDVRTLPINEMFASLLKTIQHIERLVSSDELTMTARTLERTISNVDRLVNNVNGNFHPLSSELKGMITDLRKLIKEIDKQTTILTSESRETLVSTRQTVAKIGDTFYSLEQMAGPHSAFNVELSNMLAEISAAAHSFKLMADTLERHPEALFYGKNPAGID